MRTSGRTALLTKANLHRAGSRGKKKKKQKHIKRGAKGHTLSLSPVRWGTLLFASLDRHALRP